MLYNKLTLKLTSDEPNKINNSTVGMYDMNDFYEKLVKLQSSGDHETTLAFIRDTIDGSPESSPERAGLYNELAGYYKSLNNYDEAEIAFALSLNLFDELKMGASPEYATVLLNLAGLYRMKGEPGRAIELFHGIITKLEGEGQQNSYSYISILNNFALVYQEEGDYTNALEYAEKALKLMRDGRSGAHEIAASLNNLAAIYIKLDDLETADKLISEALALYDSMREIDLHHAAALTTKAVVQCRTGDFSGALEGFQQSLEFIGRFYGENVEFAICKRNISDIFELLGNLPSAISELSDSTRILERILGPDHQKVQEARARLKALETSTINS